MKPLSDLPRSHRKPVVDRDEIRIQVFRLYEFFSIDLDQQQVGEVISPHF
jgi:hypothetical protein